MPLVLVLLLSSTVFITLKGQRVLSTLFGVELGATPLQMGVLFAMNGLFPFLLAVTAGRIADRLDNRIIMYGGIAGYAGCLLLPHFFPTLPMLYVAVAISGLSSADAHAELQLLQPRGIRGCNHRPREHRLFDRCLPLPGHISVPRDLYRQLRPDPRRRASPDPGGHAPRERNRRPAPHG